MMKLSLEFAWLVTLVCCCYSAITPSDYIVKIGYGFTTNWFKSLVPLSKYSKSIVQDVYDAGFRNFRLRCRADIHEHDGSAFTSFLDDLEKVVDDCIEIGVTPIISWIHHHDEIYPTDQAQADYVAWWQAVATRMENKSHDLSFNLFNELGFTGCPGVQKCPDSLRMNPDKYNNWTANVVNAIRAVGGSNTERILILAAPGKLVESLVNINSAIYEDDSYMMAEWHIYASGPTHREGLKHWVGNGSEEDRATLVGVLTKAEEYTTSSGLHTYFAEWMPWDNQRGTLNQTEVENFAKYFVSEIKKTNIPWSLNVLDKFYETNLNALGWKTGIQEITGASLNLSLVFDIIKSEM